MKSIGRFIAALFALVLVTGTRLDAALMASQLETFSGGGSGSANTAIYTLSTSTISTFTLENSVTDGGFLDGADDGYAMMHRTATNNQNVTVLGNYGTIEVGDIGKVVTIDAAFRHEAGTTVDWSIQLDGANIGVEGQQSFFRAATFSMSDWNPDTNYQLSTLAAGSQNSGRTTGPLTYTIQAGDVGSTLGLRINYFDSSNGGGEGLRDIYIDSISYTIPEPSVPMLGAVMSLMLLLRRARRA